MIQEVQTALNFSKKKKFDEKQVEPQSQTDSQSRNPTS